jgi:hypothetical protein
VSWHHALDVMICIMGPWFLCLVPVVMTMGSLVKPPAPSRCVQVPLRWRKDILAAGFPRSTHNALFMRDSGVRGRGVRGGRSVVKGAFTEDGVKGAFTEGHPGPAGDSSTRTPSRGRCRLMGVFTEALMGVFTEDRRLWVLLPKALRVLLPKAPSKGCFYRSPYGCLYRNPRPEKRLRVLLPKAGAVAWYPLTGL